ncbi:MAG: BrnT family toxin [Geminicoccaceae bacterium]
MVKFHVSEFDWDEGNRAKCQKHGLSLTEIEQFFEQDLHLAPDQKHSKEERRFLAVGRSSKGRPMFVVFTLRQQDDTTLIRPISARYMHAREAKRYDQESAKFQD